MYAKQEIALYERNLQVASFRRSMVHTTSNVAPTPPLPGPHSMVPSEGFSCNHAPKTILSRIDL